MAVHDHIETERTFLRKLSVEDARDFYGLNLDQEVLKYTGDKPFENIKTAKDFLINYDQYERYRVGRLAVIEKKTSKFIGWCGLKYNSDTDEYNIGFRFFKQYWNKGFATETAKKCLNYGFNDLKIQRIIGRAMKENIASIKVLEKMGMTFKDTFAFDEHQGLIYELTIDDYKKRNRTVNISFAIW
jgi:RimJ/RimL family protein N-acetyltransferase